MKVLNPTVSIVMASHMKPDYLPSAIDSVLGQTRLDLQLIVVDSGEWINTPVEGVMGPIQANYSAHPLIEWYSLGEPPRLIDRKCPYAYIWNLAIRELVRGKYVCFFSDDDLYYPEFIEKMAGYLDGHPDDQAVFCAQERVDVQADGTMTLAALQIPAETTRSTFDNHVDMLQMMVRYELLLEMSPWNHPAQGDWKTFEWFPEDPDPASCRHADGIFMDRVGQLVGEVPNIAQALTVHRYTPVSTYN